MDPKSLVIQRWIVKAESDFHTARTMIDSDPIPTDVICFHCQQCAEKYLKSVLVNEDRDIPRIHDLQRIHYLCLQCNPLFTEIESSCIALSDYAVEVRYVDDWRDISLDEAKEALIHIETIRIFVRRYLQIP